MGHWECSNESFCSAVIFQCLLQFIPTFQQQILLELLSSNIIHFKITKLLNISIQYFLFKKKKKEIYEEAQMKGTFLIV